jgi:hypothetical protein
LLERVTTQPGSVAVPRASSTSLASYTRSSPGPSITPCATAFPPARSSSGPASVGPPVASALIVTSAVGRGGLWRDEARGAIDVYAFTSTASPDRRTLAELLRAQAVDDAIATLRDPDGDPRAEFAAAASLVLAAAARRALAQADPAVATALRGSFGADSAGAVRYRASAVAFALVIEATG